MAKLQAFEYRRNNRFSSIYLPCKHDRCDFYKSRLLCNLKTMEINKASLLTFDEGYINQFKPNPTHHISKLVPNRLNFTSIGLSILVITIYVTSHKYTSLIKRALCYQTMSNKLHRRRNWSI